MIVNQEDQEALLTNMALVQPGRFRDLIISAHKLGLGSWGETFVELYNLGWRGPMDRDGFPTTRQLR